MNKEVNDLLKAAEARFDNLAAYKFYAMDYCGGLKEAVETIERITEEEFKNLLQFYDFYCYDERIECLRFLLKDMKNNYPIGQGKIHSEWLLISSCNLKTIKELAKQNG